MQKLRQQSSSESQQKTVGFRAKYSFLLKDHRRKLLAMTLLFITLSVFDLLGIGLIGPFIGAIINPAELAKVGVLQGTILPADGSVTSRSIGILGGILLVVFLFKGGMAYWVQRRIFAFSFEFKSHLIKKLMHAYLRMPYQFYLERNSSTVIQSVIAHTKVMSDDLLIPSLRVASDVMMMTIIGAFLFWVNPQAMLLLSGMLGSAFYLYISFVRPRVRQAGEDASVTHERMIRGVNQGIGGIKEIRVLRVEDAFFSEVANAADEAAKSFLRFSSLLVIPRYLMETVLVFFVVALSLYVVYQGDDTTQLISVLAMFGAAGMRILPAVTQISSSLASINYSSFALDELYRDLKLVEAAQKADRDIPAVTDLGASQPFERLDISGIAYCYPGADRNAIDGISLSFSRGQSIGFIGESGAGKTTLVDILLGLHHIDSGLIEVNGNNIDQYGWNNWINQIAYIPQSVFLIDDTLEANVAFGVPSEQIDTSRVNDAINAAQLSDLVARLPEGIHTKLGERGIRLSGGERQRVALARALYHDRDVFILDEATSALDAETERQIVEVIEKLHGKKTLIVIAHRLTTVKNCDRIFRFNAGQVIASGSYGEVVEGKN